MVYIMSVKKRAKRIYNKGHHHAKKIAQRGTAIMFALILFVGILLPAGVGYAMEKMDGVAVNTLIASSGDSTNSSVILSKSAEYWNGQYVYRLDVVSMNGWDYVMTDTQNQVGTATSTQVFYCWAINASVLKNTDKIIVYYNAVDGVLKNDSGRMIIRTGSGDIVYYNREYDNATGAYKIEVPMTPNILLKSAGDSTIRIYVDGLNCEDGNPVGRTYKAKLELYDAKGLDANSTKTMFLAGSGILMLIAGLCATPWINPSEIARKKGWL